MVVVAGMVLRVAVELPVPNKSCAFFFGGGNGAEPD
jgi:hypothetical protein